MYGAPAYPQQSPYGAAPMAMPYGYGASPGQPGMQPPPVPPPGYGNGYGAAAAYGGQAAPTAFDPMAPVDVPHAGNGGKADQSPSSYSGQAPYGAAVPMGSVPTGTIPTGSIPTGTVPMGTVSTGSVPRGTVPEAPVEPKFRGSTAAVATVAAKRHQKSQNMLFVAAAAGGAILLAGALAISALNSGDTPVAQNHAGNQVTPTATAPVHKAAIPRKPEAKPAPRPQPTSTASERKGTPNTEAMKPAMPETMPAEAAVPKPPTPAPESMPEPKPAPTPPQPTPTPTPTPPPPPPKPVPPPEPVVQPTREELVALGKALTTAKAALGEQNFAEADQALARADKLAKLPEHRAMVGRLTTLASYVRQFRKAIEAATKEMEAASTFQVGSSTQVAVVETFPDKIILRIAGMNRTYPFRDLPIGLAVAIADFKLDQSDPVSLVVKGAYIAADRRAESDQLDKAKAWWQDAEKAGVDLGDLPKVLTDSYDFAKAATKPEKT
jgi:hypothetical protein